MANITVKNLDSLTRKLNNISKMDVKNTMNDAIKRVHAHAKSLAPVDSGDLAGSIHMEVNMLPNGVQGRVYTNLEYAMYVEFGTGVRGNGSYPYDLKDIKLAYHEDWAGMVAQPYMYPALKNNEKYIRKLFKDGVKDELKANCKGGI